MCRALLAHRREALNSLKKVTACATRTLKMMFPIFTGLCLSALRDENRCTHLFSFLFELPYFFFEEGQFSLYLRKLSSELSHIMVNSTAGWVDWHKRWLQATNLAVEITELAYLECLHGNDLIYRQLSSERNMLAQCWVESLNHVRLHGRHACLTQKLLRKQLVVLCAKLTTTTIKVVLHSFFKFEKETISSLR